MVSVPAIDLGPGVQNAWRNVIEFVPRFVAFLVILLVAWIVAKVLAKVVNAVLERVGFDRVVDRGGVRAALARSRYDASDLVARIVYYAVLLVGLSLAFGVFGPNPISAYLASIVAYLPKLAVALFIVVIAAAIARAVREVVGAALGGLSYGQALATAAGVAVLALGVIAALNQLQIAQPVVLAVLYAALAALVGIVVVGVGGGLVRPMQARWERALARMEEEAPRARQEWRANKPAAPPAPTEYPPAYPSGTTAARGPTASTADEPTQVFPQPGRSPRDAGGL
jgi:MFS family permease